MRILRARGKYGDLLYEADSHEMLYRVCAVILKNRLKLTDYYYFEYDDEEIKKDEEKLVELENALTLVDDRDIKIEVTRKITNVKNSLSEKKSHYNTN